MQTNVLEWLDETSRLYPDKLALCDEFEQYSFREYREKAIGIADLLISRKKATKIPVVVYLEKSAKVLVSFMGTAYAGNFYSPIDVQMPASRVNKILEILQPEIVITSRSLKDEFAKFHYSGEYILYEDVLPMKHSERVKNVQKHILDTDLLYVLFTSGSTGTPKGVCITHRGIINLADWMTKEFNISSEDSLANQAPFYFDASVPDVYLTIKTGASLYITPTALFSQPVRLLRYLAEAKVNTLIWVPSALVVVARLKALKSVDLGAVLKKVMFCGEAMPNKQLNVWRKYLPNVTYVNLYGPTEATYACTYYVVDRAFSDNERLPIGTAMDNMNVLILDEQDRLVTEASQVGELCVRGTGVALGYYNNPEKTKAAFVQNPLNTAYEEKIYRTGDLVQYNDRHELIYLSRKDFQIKHMGHRIELGEIETAVSSLEEITMCCCLYDESKSKIVLFIDQNMERSEINERLSEMLPEYMLPGKVVYMATLPLNSNGKIDRVRLKEWL